MAFRQKFGALPPTTNVCELAAVHRALGTSPLGHSSASVHGCWQPVGNSWLLLETVASGWMHGRRTAGPAYCESPQRKATVLHTVDRGLVLESQQYSTLVIENDR
jgi:hypothetical protein